MQLQIHYTCIAAFIKIYQRHATTWATSLRCAAQEEVIRARVEKRAKHTGRSIPEDKLKASIAAVERCGLEACVTVVVSCSTIMENV